MDVFGLTSVTCLSILFSFVLSEEVKSLCEDPVIHAADRLGNNTYRVYRDYHYWELVGLPDTKVKVNGPYPIWYQHMAPIDKYSSIQTVIGGSADGLTYKFRAEKFWIYSRDGSLIQGGKPGFDWSLFPRNGFNAVLNDGRLNGSRFPIMIAFSGIYVYYYNTNDRIFRRIGSENGYRGGMYGEKFPPDLTAAFSFDQSNQFYVYLFQRKRYCYRPFIGEDGCKTWRNNTELFGCSASDMATNSPDESQAEESQSEKPPEDPNPNPGEAAESTGADPGGDTKSTSGGGGSGGSGAIFLIVIIVVVLVVVAIVIAIVVFAMKRKQPPKPAPKSPKAPPPKSKTGMSAKSGKPVSSKA